MKKIVMATTNNNKVERVRKLLKETDYEVVSLKDYSNLNIIEPKETADTPVGIAIEDDDALVKLDKDLSESIKTLLSNI